MFSKNIDRGFFSTEEIYGFLHDVKYILILYIAGDFITTFHALSSGYGFEENNMLSGIMGNYGIWSLLLVKLVILMIIYWNYISVKSSVYWYAERLWNLSRTAIGLLGLVLVINNLMVIFVRLSLFEYLGLS